MTGPIDTRSPTAEQPLPPRSGSLFSSLLPCSAEMIGNQRGDFLRKQNHAQDHGNGSPQQNTAKPPSPHCTLLGMILLPKSERDQSNRDSQKPRTQSCEESTRRSSS